MIPDKVKRSTVWRNKRWSDLDVDEQVQNLQFQEFLISVNFVSGNLRFDNFEYLKIWRLGKSKKLWLHIVRLQIVLANLEEIWLSRISF